MNTRLKILSLTATLLVISALQLLSAGAAGPDPAGAARAPVAARQVPSKITNALANVPPDITGESGQFATDVNAWLTFIALNWPATAKCGPNMNATILSGAGPTVWETYLTDDEVFVAPGFQPLPWCPQPNGLAAARLGGLPPAVRRQAQREGARQVFSRLSKASPKLKRKAGAGLGPQRFPGIEQAVGGPVTDQNGRFVRYAVHLNKDEYDFLKTNNLWNRKGQDHYTNTLKKTITFPAGNSRTGVVGAIEVKAAWKVLSPSEIAGKRFYMTKGVIYNNEKRQGSSVATLGLVGLHIIHKTASQRNWIWATFEHVDNLTAPPGSPLDAKASFFNPGCPPSICSPNAQTASQPYTELGTNGQPLNQPVQVVRLNPVQTQVFQPDTNVDKLNQTFRGLLQGSVWANYQLISAQWEGEIPIGVKPGYLANVVTETYVQGPVPASDGLFKYPSPEYNPFASCVTSSCLKCHSVAVTASALANNQPQPKADFSFIMGNAQ